MHTTLVQVKAIFGPFYYTRGSRRVHPREICDTGNKNMLLGFNLEKYQNFGSLEQFVCANSKSVIPHNEVAD